MEWFPIEWEKMGKREESAGFIGTYFHSVDERNRISVPKRFRKDLGAVAVVTKGLDGCLFLFGMNAWINIAALIQKTPLTNTNARSFARHMLSGAMEVELDTLGRIILPVYLKQFAQIKKNVAVIGVGERIEIWEKERWESYSKESEKRSDEIAERLTEFGL